MDGSVVIQAVLDSSKVEKGVSDVNKSLNKVSWKGIKEGDQAAQQLSGSLKSAGTAATVGLTAPIVAAGTAAMTTASSYESATARIQSALGLTAEEAEHLGDVGESIYENGFGESLDAVDDALITVRQSIGDLNDVDLTYVTQAALTLSDTLGMDVGESVRGINALMDGFGLSAQEAMDLFVAGAQDGLNYSDELGDNLAEYGPRFAQMGFSAEEYFSILKAGTENGAYNLDKVNDFLNEFQTSLSDGRMDENIGRFSDSTQKLFQSWKEGGATGQQVFEAVMGELAQMPDGYEKANLASTLWSSLGEDNAMGMITSLAGVENKYGDVAGAAQEAADTASDSFASKAQSAMRELMGAIEPLGTPLLNIATNVAGCIQAFGEWFSGIGEGGQMAVLALAGILAAVGPVLSVAGNVVTVLPAITSALGGATAATGAASGATGALGGALTALTGPVGIVLGVLAALTAAIVYLWNTDDGFRVAVSEAWNAIWGTIQGVIDQLRPYVEQAWAAIQNAVSTAMNVIMPIVSQGFQFIIAVAVPILQQLISNVANTFQVILETITGVMNGVTQIINGAWQIIQGIFQTVVGFIVGLVTGDFSQMQAGVDAIMQGIKTVIGGALDAAGAVVTGAINFITSTIQNGLNLALSVVQGIFNGIKSAIEGPINGARDVVGGAIEAIKGFFNFRISWPHIPMPHFGVSPSGWQIGDLLRGVIPSLSIEWYAKGGVFNGPSVIGVGEAGPEAVVPLSGSRVRPFAEAVAEGIVSALGGSREGRGGVTQNFNFYQPIKSPDEVARAVRLSERYGLAAET
ncbi:phage tail tape measure protein [Olsenella sp. An188]|uniref:phage tail tape measure protein n=1 Tax=Olsenella sp. An188 TaxID=1965579 RepID=UPI000B369E7F|nr:phage tail tape measure protein [Olsenella sp. An188]OUP37966.1 hypothetical protein B5F23_08395 [Olsenella sp. An188]